MSKKRHKENRQLSLTLEPDEVIELPVITVSSVQRQSATVLQFPSKQACAASFRERVIRELATTRVMLIEQG